MTQRECFGILDHVFPAGEHGLREVAAGCFDCADRVLCLRAALETRQGLEMRAEMLARASEPGMAGKLKRWSRRKGLSRLMEQTEAKKRWWWR